MERSCVSCRHANPVAEGSDGEPFVECRRFPPVIVVVDGDLVRLFPTVDADDWCSEHDPLAGP